MESWEFRQRQSLPYEAKLIHAEKTAQEFYNRVENCHISVGGLDSITLLLFLQAVGINVPAISVLEDKSIQSIHKKLGVQRLSPCKSKVEVIQEFGFPVISKQIAGKIEFLQNLSEDNQTVRHAIITGDTGKQGGYRKGTRMKLPDKWLRLISGCFLSRQTNYGDSEKDV